MQSLCEALLHEAPALLLSVLRVVEIYRIIIFICDVIKTIVATQSLDNFTHSTFLYSGHFYSAHWTLSFSVSVARL